MTPFPFNIFPFLQNLFLYVALLQVGAALLFAAFVYNQLVLKPRRFGIENVPGPPTDSYLFGIFRTYMKTPPGILHEKLTEIYGPTMRFQGIFCDQRLYSLDPRFINHVYSHPEIYEKPVQLRGLMESVTGPGILSAVGDVHRRQRKILLPSFSPSSIRALVPAMLAKAHELSKAISLESSKDPKREMEISRWLSKATLDIIGKTGFDFDMQSLDPNSRNPLSEAYMEAGLHGLRMDARQILTSVFPVLRRLPSAQDRALAKAMKVVNEFGLEIVQARRAAILAETGSSTLKRADFDVAGRDLLTSMIRANLASDLPPSGKLTDEELMAGISTFVFAGTDTTSVALSWTLFALCENLDVQTKLRNELLSVADENPDLEQLEALPYLDAVILESIRVYPSVPNTQRVAVHDDVIPLSMPVKGRDGKEITELRIKAGTPLWLPFVAFNRSTPTWGEDAKLFRPERWFEQMPDSSKELNSAWGHVATFFGGSTGCIGFKFALAEMRAILFVLLRNHKFSHIDDHPRYFGGHSITVPILVEGREKEGSMVFVKVEDVKEG